VTDEAHIDQAVETLARLGNPTTAVILGSGLSDVLRPAGAHSLAFTDIPGFPRPSVAGHTGHVEVGTIQDSTVLVQRGRVHYYEGYSLPEVVLPVRTYVRLGVRNLVITNASGAIAPRLSPGDLVLITDHLNMLGANPLQGPNLDSLGPRFPDMSHAYSPKLRALAEETSNSLGISLRQGVYVAVPGPSYETPAEITAFGRLGADLVGMSTVPEVIAARHGGLQVLGISCVTNLAAGISAQPLSHDEVVETTRRKAAELDRLLSALLPRLD